MLFTLLALAAAPQALGLRPSATSMAKSAQFSKLREFAKAAPSNDPTTALQEVASVVNSIMIQAGNATDHLTDEDQTLLNRVIAVITDSMYGSMTTAHGSDETALADAIDAINQCYMDFTARATGGGDLVAMEESVRTYQNSLNGLQDDVDAKTELNDTYWHLLKDHMSLISPAPDCEPLPTPRTMPSLDVYFESNPYVVWWNAQKLAYEPVSAAFKFADHQLRLALTAYAVGLGVRDVAYCDWKRELDAACAQFSACYEAAKAHYLNVVKPAVEEDVKMRIEAYKAGETIIHQIKFLLAVEANQATPAINTDVYQIAFPEVPAKPACDMSALDDAAWVPTPECRARQETRSACEWINHGSHRECHMINKGICYGRVKYGFGNTWTEWRDMAGEFECTNAVFGDPFRGQAKECICDEVVPQCALDEPVFIVGHRDQVLADHGGSIIMHSNRLNWETWTISTGDIRTEHGLLITSHQNLQVQDNNNNLRMHQNKLSWETWVFSPAGDGKVFIASHRDRYLGDHDGTVLLHANKHMWERWTITKKNGELACH